MMKDSQATAIAQPPVEVGAATLVVPLDGSEQATAALPVARALAEVEHAVVHILHVNEETRAAGEMFDSLKISLDDLDGAVLDQREGPVAEAIVREARDLGSSFIVMASRCTSQEGHGALGGVTREVLRAAPCPVVLVRHDRVKCPWALRQILLPHDGIPTTAAAIARAADLAVKSRAELAVLHIASTAAPPPGEPGALMAPRYLDAPQYEWPDWAREFMDRLRAIGGPPPEARMRLFFGCGEPADVIVDFAAQHQTDLVVIAWVAGWEPEQRTTMRKVIDQAPGPLMIFPLEEPQGGMMF